MISGIFHQGSGLGNQLHRYIATRVLALDKGYEFSMVAPELFKGKDFMNLDMGIDMQIPYSVEYPAGKVCVETPHYMFFDEETNYYNPEFNFIEDNTIIDGEFQDERYFEHWLPDILKWLHVEPIYVPDDVCVIGFRGGEFYTVPELGLPKEYYDKGIEIMKKEGITKFEVHTDDEVLAKQFFPNYKVIHDIGINWRSMLCAKYAIIANSSFFILPRLINGGMTIAPRYWDRYNIKKWERPYNYYKSFQYV